MTDYTVGDTVRFMFTTRRFSTGAPFSLASGVISAYENEDLTQITAGITLGVDHDGVTGLNLVTVVASGANGFELGKDYHLVITTGTVDSVSVVGEVVGRFTLGRSAAAVDLANATDGLGAIKTDTAAILVDTGTTLDVKVDDLPTNAELATALGTADDAVLAQVALVKAKTDNLPSDPADQSLIIAATDALATMIGDVPTNAELATALAAADDAVLAAIAALNNLSAAAVNAEVVDALATDTYAEPGQGAPAATASLVVKVGHLYKMLRNKKEQTASQFSLYNDAADTVDQKSTVSDNATTATRGELASGP